MKKIKQSRIIQLIVIAVMLMNCLSYFTMLSRAEDADSKKTVRIPYGINDSLYMDENGNMAGYCKDYLDGLAEINNWEYEYVETTWTEAMDLLEEEKIDILFPTTKLPEREDIMDFSEMIGGYMAYGLFAKKDSNFAYEDFEAFDGVRIAISKNSSNEAALPSFAKLHGFTYEPVYIAAMEDKLKALEEGSVDMIVVSAANGIPDSKLVSVIETNPFYYAVKKGNTELLAEINSGMEKLLIDNPELLTDVYENCFMNSNENMPAFTLKERDFIKSGTKITIGFYMHMEPLAYVDSDGNSGGIYIEILERIKDVTGLNIELYPMEHDMYWQDLLKDGTIDFYIGSSEKMTSNASEFVSTNVFMDYDAVLITRNDFEVAGENNVKVALTKYRSYWKDNFPEGFEDADIIYYETAKDCLIAVKNGEADMTLLNTFVYNYQTKNIRFSDLVQWENYKFKSGTVMTALADVDPAMYSVMNKSLKIIKESKMNDIINSHLNMAYHTSDFYDNIYAARWWLILVVFVLLALGITTITVSRIRKKQNVIMELNREREKQQLRIMSAMNIDYVAVYYVNLDNDTFMIEKITPHLRGEVSNVVKRSESFSATFLQYIEAFVLPEYRDNLKTLFEKENLIERFKNAKAFSVRYKVKPNENNQDYFEVHLVDVSENENEHLMVIGFRCIDEIVGEEIAQKEILEAANAKLNKQMRIVGSFGNIYSATLVCDLEHNIIEEIDMPEFAKVMITESGGELKSAIDILCRELVQDTHQDRMREFLDISTMSERIGDKKVISQEYISAQSEWRRCNIIPMERDEDGTVTRMIFTVQQINEEKRKELETQEALKDAYEAAYRANQAKSDFLSKMSHDMRTPMNAIIGMTAIAGVHIDDKERVRDSLDKITSASRHLLGLINEVLDMSKIESGKASLVEEEFNLSDLLNNILTIVKPSIAEYDHKLQVHIHNIEHEDVVGDGIRLQQVFLNIMGNAIKYTPKGGTICLTVSEKPSRQRLAGCYEFVFEDNGIGMTEEYMEQIFEPFTRAEDVRISKIQGTGLGMPIAMNIVQMMNGNIQVESEVGKGSKFTVTIYLKLQDKHELSMEEFAGLSVLVVDDDRIACETTCEILSEFGMNSEWVLSGKEAVKLVETRHRDNHDFYAIILDWKMKGMDGLETAGAIRRIVNTEVPIIIISAYDWSDIEMDARNVGVNAFLSKPVFKSGISRLFKTLKYGAADETIKQELENVVNSDYSGKRVLLVEDNDLNREIAEEILKMTGMEIDKAENGKIAVDIFAASAIGTYDMILMDVQMPVMNGYEAASAIRSLNREDAADIPIIAMTANAFAEDIQDAKKSGMNEHLAKPLDFDKMAEVFARYLNRNNPNG